VPGVAAAVGAAAIASAAAPAATSGTMRFILMRMVFPSSVCGAVSQYNAAAAGGVSDFPDVLLTLFRGENTGKLVLALPTE
jgi:hypothetical protein